MSITCWIAIDKRDCVLPVVEGETVIQYCNRLVLAGYLRVNSSSLTCTGILMQDDKIINQADQRHRKIGNLIDFTKPIIATFWLFTSLSTFALIKGNMDPSGFEPNLIECPICLEEFTPKKEFVSLKCSHRFHMACIAKQSVDTCPLCRASIPKSVMILYRNRSASVAIV